jgi:Cu/Ag efflux protein CusF
MHIKTIILISACAGFVGCGGKTAQSTPNARPPSAESPAKPASNPANADYPGKGKVTKINLNLGSVELDHENIEGVMPAMRMEFYVSDKSLLNGLAVGDSVEFTLRYKDGTETVVGINKVQ